MHYIPMGNWFELGNSPMNVDIESFEVLPPFIAKDQHNAYYDRFSINPDEVDLKTFFTKSREYMCRMAFYKNHVYIFHQVYDTKNFYVKTAIVEDADPKSYIKTFFFWAKDDNKCFYRDKKVAVDFDSFTNINERFSRDSSTIYHYYVGDFSAINADIETFEVLEDPIFARDKSMLFCSLFISSEEGTKLETLPIGKDEKVAVLNKVFIQIGDRVYYYTSPLEKWKNWTQTP